MVLSFWWIIQSRLFCCLQLRNMSEKFWQYWMLSLEDRQPEKRSISAWQGLVWLCCWETSCCCYCCWGYDSELDEDPPNTLRTAWWATAEPTPNPKPCIMVLPIPPNIPVLAGGVWVGVWVGCFAGTGLVAVVAERDGGAGDDDLPLLELPLDEPPLEPPLPII